MTKIKEKIINSNNKIMHFLLNDLLFTPSFPNIIPIKNNGIRVTIIINEVECQNATDNINKK